MDQTDQLITECERYVFVKSNYLSDKYIREIATLYIHVHIIISNLGLY